MQEIEASGNTALLDAINQLDSLTVLAPVDGVLSRGYRKRMQQQGNENWRTDSWGAYMVPGYQDFGELVKIASLVEGHLDTMSTCGWFEVTGQLDDKTMLLRDPLGEDVVLDRRDQVPGNGQVMVHPIKTLVGVKSSCKLGYALWFVLMDTWTK